MLGDLIAQIDRPEVAGSVLEGLPAPVLQQLEARAAAAHMSLPDFAAGAVHEFVERADDDLWFQLLTVIRKSDEPGLVAIRTILQWVTEPKASP